VAVDDIIKLLIVEEKEDEAEDVIVAMAKSALNFEATWAKDLRELVTKLEAGAGDLVISDYQHSGFTVDVVLAALSQIDETIPLIVVSDAIGENRTAEVMRAGARDVVRKDELHRLAPTIEREIVEAAMRRQRAEALRRIKHLDQAIEQSANLIFMTDPDGNIEYANARVLEAYGYAKEEVIGSNPRLWKSGKTPASVYQNLWKTILRGDVWHGEIRNQSSSGEPVWVSATISPIKADDGRITGFIGIQENITELRISQAQLIQAPKMATLGEMATAIAHELNQPLSVIRMAADRGVEALEDGDADEPFLTDRFRTISTQIIRAGSIIDHMRVFGRKDEREPEPFDPKEAIDSALGMMRAQLRLRCIEVVTDFPEICRPVRGNRIQFEQAMLNLITNARDSIEAHVPERADCASGNGRGGTINLAINEDSAHNALDISVDDSGGGFPEELADRLFEPFFTTKEVGSGTGLGLSISYGIVTEMGGSISAANTDAGARFLIRLPVA